MHKALASIGIVLILLVALPARANPGNSERYPVGARATGMGGAGMAFSSHPWINLAGLGHAAEEGISGSLSAYGFTSLRVDTFVEGGDIQGTLASSSVDIFPASLAYIKPLGKLGTLHHGIGVAVVVANYDQFDGTANIPADALAFELKVVRQATAQTSWLTAGWAGCTNNERLCFGLGPAMALHQQSDLFLLTVSSVGEEGTVDYSSSSKADVKALAIGGQMGLQAQVTPNWWVGLTARSPVRTIFSSGTILAIENSVDTTGGESYIDRVEIQNPQVDYRQPWRIGVGVGYENAGKFAAGLDLRITTAQGRHATLAGESGELAIQPVDIFGQRNTDPERAVDIAEFVERDRTFNMNAGIESNLSEKLAMQVGLFTDISSTPIEMVRSGEMDDRITRYGATLGLGLRSKKATTWLTLIGAYGGGQSVGFDQNFESQTPDLVSWSVIAMLGSNAKLGD